MFLKSLSLQNYGIFCDADFDLSTTVDKPILLMTGNNGAGKTSILEALRLALHGKRAFDVPIAESEYSRIMQRRFHAGNLARECAVSLSFDYLDQYTTRNIQVRRSWTERRQSVVEEVHLLLDGTPLPSADADDLLASIVPPEIARYFFFDGERIRELAEWETEDEAALFFAVSELLGLNILEQLRNDLLRLSVTDERAQKTARDVSSTLLEAQETFAKVKDKLKSAKAQLRKSGGRVDRARANIRRLGALLQSELAETQATLATLYAEQRSLTEDLERLSSDLLPLLCARTLRSRFAREIQGQRQLEEREIVNDYLATHSDDLRRELQQEGVTKIDVRRILAVVDKVVRGKPMPVNSTLPNMSRSDSVWMQRIIEKELPAVEEEAKRAVARLSEVEDAIASLEERVRKSPVNDPAGDAALSDLEEAQRLHIQHETEVRQLEQRLAEAQERLEVAQQAAKEQRLAAFRAGRLKLREKLMASVLEALPKLGEQLQSSKEQRFAHHLSEALETLWNKKKRVERIDVSFGSRRIALFGSHSELHKRDLSAGEKQLFAVAFIYALARISGRMMPFIIDTPLGRLDRSHRERFVTEFVPSMGHQVIMLSTDTEIVGKLYTSIQPLIARHYELSDYNGLATSPVELALA